VPLKNRFFQGWFLSQLIFVDFSAVAIKHNISPISQRWFWYQKTDFNYDRPHPITIVSIGYYIDISNYFSKLDKAFSHWPLRFWLSRMTGSHRMDPVMHLFMAGLPAQ
jgi:hypothetical protein